MWGWPRKEVVEGGGNKENKGINSVTDAVIYKLLCVDLLDRARNIPVQHPNTRVLAEQSRTKIFLGADGQEKVIVNLLSIES